MKDIPIISLKNHLDGKLDAEAYRTLARACEDHGFFLLSDHGEQPLIDSVFDSSEQFFAQAKDKKMEVFRDELNPLGYFDRELTKQRRDQKEVYDFKAGGYISSDPNKQTRWPNSPEGFQDVLTNFFTTFTTLSEQTMGMVFHSLGMPLAEVADTMQSGFGEAHSSAARLNFYPSADPVPDGQRSSVTPLGDMALHHHTDPGAITLLLQDNQGGLQALSKEDGWIDVPPKEGTIVVNVGDVLQVWTNDRCTAGCHRVLPVASQQGRFSTPFFYQPRYDAQVSPWLQEGDEARYKSFSWREYIRGRVTDNFADYGDSDIQIERYRIAS
ncbi:MAG: isopenicillin N synthase-like dioxygenase [Limisphaerales bacterium]